MQYLKIPNDPALETRGGENRLIVSVHCYDPYQFALNDVTHKWGSMVPASERDSGSQEAGILSTMTQLKTKFIDNGYPVIIGEYGATMRANPAHTKYREYYMEYVTKAMFDAGITPYYWDNGSSKGGAESFGLFNRNTATVVSSCQGTLNAMMRAVTKDYKITDILSPEAQKFVADLKAEK
jgi:endoglucanase